MDTEKGPKEIVTGRVWSRVRGMLGWIRMIVNVIYIILLCHHTDHVQSANDMIPHHVVS